MGGFGGLGGASITTAKGINAIGKVAATAGFNTASTSFVDVTNPATLTLTTTKVCTVVAFAQIPNYNSTLQAYNYFLLEIDTTASNATGDSVPVANNPLSTFCQGIKTGVAAGSVTIKLRMKVNGGTGYINYSAGLQECTIIAYAIEE